MARRMRRGLTDVLRTSNSARTAGISHGDSAGTYLDVRGAKRVVNATDGVGSHADASSGHWDVQSVETEAITPANATQIVSIPRKKTKPPDLPGGATRWTPDASDGLGDHADTSNIRTDVQSVETDALTPANEPETVRTTQNDSTRNSPESAAKWTPDEPDGCGSHADGSSVHTDTQSVGNATGTATNEAKRVRMRQSSSRTRNSPNGRDIATPKPTSRWKKVSVGDGDVYVPSNAPIEVLGTANRRIVFGRAESGDEAIAPSLKGERAGNGDGDGYGGDGGDGDVDGTTSSGHIDSSRVEEALLAAESQHTRYSSRLRRNNLPVSSWPPIQPERRPYGHVRRRQRRGRLKIERINEDQVSKAQRVETTHLTHAHATQPPGNTPNRAYGIYRPRRQRGRIKIAPTNVSRTQKVENTYLGRDIVLRSIRRPKKNVRRLDKFTFQCRMPGERRRDDGDYG